MNEPCHVIPLHVCSGWMKNYSYIVFKEACDDAIVIDPAWEFEKYLNTFDKHKIVPKTILLTHLHHDHTNLLDQFLKKYSLDIWVAIQAKGKFVINSPKLFFFHHEEILELSNLSCKAYITPGHTPESSCFLIESNLFTGDTLFIEGCGMCFDETADPEDLYSSIQFLKTNVAPEVKIYPGHRYREYPGISFKDVFKKNIYLHIDNKESFIKFRMRPNQFNLLNFK